jgi:signal transduction histidine kinase
LAAEYTLIPYVWRRQIALLRVLLGVAGLLIYLLSPGANKLVMPFVLGVYTLYGLFSLIWSRIELSSYTHITLVLDTLVFLLCTSFPNQYSIWLNSVLWFFLLLVTALVHEWQRSWIVVAICLAFFLITRPGGIAEFWPTVLVGGLLACALSLQKKMLQDRLYLAFRRTVLARSDADLARESERRRIAADLHDGPLQSFISFQMRLEIVKKLIARDVNMAVQELSQLQEICKTQVTEMRSFVRSMRPVELDGDSLVSSIRQLVQAFQKDTRIAATFLGGTESATTGPELGLEVIQIVREALHNVEKHAKASRVTVTVMSADRAVEVTVEDDGSGFSFAGAYSLEELELLRLGPISIKRRVRSLNGDLLLESRPGKGATMKIKVPIP